MAIQRLYHFEVEFYSDPSFQNLVATFSSVDFWPYFSSNGASFSPGGIYIQDFTCVNISFELPPDAPDELFNKIYFSKYKAILSGIDFSDIAADIVFVVDDSGSMETEHAWLTNLAPSFESKLNAAGIGNNQYALVKFGSSPAAAGQVVQDFTNVSNFTSSLSVLKAYGIIEDGYEATARALSELEFRDFAVPAIILITDEDRDILRSEITRESIKEAITGTCAKTGAFTVVVNGGFVAGDGSKALGVNAEKEAYVQRGSSYTIKNRGSFTSGFGTTFQDYVSLVWEIGGSAWDLNILREGGSAAASFSEAFVDSKIKEISEAFITVDPESQLFFCERIEEDGIIDVSFNPLGGAFSSPEAISVDGTNAPDASGSIGEMDAEPATATRAYHFRMTFYADSEKKIIAHSAFSMLDSRRWFVKDIDGNTVPFNAKGEVVSPTSTLQIRYKAEVLPQELLNQQDSFSSLESADDRSLLCGVNYHVTLESYAGTDFTVIDEFEYRIPCRDALGRFWRTDQDSLNWICSGSGRTDTRVSRTDNQALKPSCDSDSRCMFMIAWQDFRGSDNDKEKMTHDPQIYYGFYDSGLDRFWTTGQGYFDALANDNGYDPIVSYLPTNKFHVTSYTRDDILAFDCNMIATTTEDANISDPCYLNELSRFSLNSSIFDANHLLNARIYSEDTSRSYTISEGNSVSVLENCLSRLDISGVAGAYAIRGRNEDDREWQDWVTIDTLTASDSSSNVSSIYRAYTIDNEILIMPWLFSAGNGIKRACFQILTLYGISNTFCVDAYLQAEELAYDVNLKIGDDALPTHNGYPVLAPLDSSGSKQTVTVEVVFKDIQEHNRLEALLTDLGKSFQVTYNVVHQGVDDLYALPLTKGETSNNNGVIYTGSFSLDASDDVFIREGLAAIVVNVPNPCLQAIPKVCNPKVIEQDIFNKQQGMSVQDAYIEYSPFINQVDPSNILSEYNKSGLKLISNTNNEKSTYDADDPRFIFGNPRHYQDK